jgi:hypothetical protein
LSARNTTLRLTANFSGFRERGKIVFSLEWQNGKQLRSSYRPGEWGA